MVQLVPHRHQHCHLGNIHQEQSLVFLDFQERKHLLDDLLLVTARIEEAGRASLTIRQQALLKPQQEDQSETLLCEGSIRIGWVDAQALRPQRIPAAILAVLAPSAV